MKKNVMVSLVLAGVLLAGCTHMHIQRSIDDYNAVADQVQLGDKKADVLALLLPTQQGLPQSDRKKSETYRQGDVVVEVFFMRVAFYMDGLVTDDEFMPYIFHDGELVGIGWQLLGGPKTQGQVQPPSTIIRGQSTIVY